MTKRSFSFFLFLFWLFAFCLVISCITPLHDALLDQELRARPGYLGLTNAVCKRFLGGSCLDQDITLYSFQDEATLKRLRAIRLVCKVGEKRFHVCGDKPALCSNTYESKSFLGVEYTTKIVTEILYIPEDLQTLIDTKAYCAAQGSESEKAMF